MLEDGQHRGNQRLQHAAGIDLFRAGLAGSHGAGVNIGDKSLQSEGKHADRTEKGGDHDNVHQVVVDEMALPDFSAVGGKVEPFDPEGFQDQAQSDENYGRYGQQNRQHLRIGHHLADHFGRGIFPNRICPQRAENLAGFGAPGALGGAVTTVVAQPDVIIGHQLILETPGCRDHFFAWIRLIVR